MGSVLLVSKTNCKYDVSCWLLICGGADRARSTTRVLRRYNSDHTGVALWYYYHGLAFIRLLPAPRPLPTRLLLREKRLGLAPQVLLAVLPLLLRLIPLPYAAMRTTFVRTTTTTAMMPMTATLRLRLQEKQPGRLRLRLLVPLPRDNSNNCFCYC